MSKHNKKRNIGIIYELLLRHISNALIENNKPKAQKALNIIEKRFKKGTQVYKEFRIANALAKSTVSGTHIAAAILQEAKQGCRNLNLSSLEKEKSALIKDINYKLNDNHFYYRNVPEYTTYATIQSLMNEWKKGDDSNLTSMIEYEKKIIDWLIQEKEENNNVEPLTEHDNLIFKLMSEKINQKYQNQFSQEQKNIINSYAILNESPEKLQNFLSDLKNNSIKSLKEFKNKNKNKVINEKIEMVLNKINVLRTENVDDELISKYLTISKLKNELRGE